MTGGLGFITEAFAEAMRQDTERTKRLAPVAERAKARWAELRGAVVAREADRVVPRTCPYRKRPLMLPEVREMLISGTLNPEPALDAARAWVAADAGTSTRFLVLFGPPGTGKTVAALAAPCEAVIDEVRAWAKRVDELEALAWVPDRSEESPSLVALEPSALDAFVMRRAELTPGRPERVDVEVWRAADVAVRWSPWSSDLDAGEKPGRRDASVLVIDDLGTETVNARMLEAFDELVDHRMHVGRTVLSMNLVRSEVRARYGARVADRLSHAAVRVPTSGPSLRNQAGGF